MPAKNLTRRRPAPTELVLLEPPHAVAVEVDTITVPVVPDDVLAPQVMPEGRLMWADCPLPAYQGLRVGYRTNNQLQIMLSIEKRTDSKAIMDDPIRFMRFVASYVRRFEGWRLQEDDGTPIPAPTPADPESYVILLGDMDLMAWVCGEGYYRAMVGGQTPNSASAS